MAPPRPADAEYAELDEIRSAGGYHDSAGTATYAGLDAFTEHSMYASNADVYLGDAGTATYAGLDAATDHSTYASNA